MDSLAKSWMVDDAGTTPGQVRQKSVFGGVSGVIRRQEKIAVVGVNGAGKSTFLKVLAGQVEPSGGTIRIGAGVLPGYFSQHSMELLNPEFTVFETVQAVIPTGNIGVIRNLCAAFLFQGDDVDKRIANLSGGEKSRVVLATLLAQPLNFLILDEPTNHLDIQSIEVLLEALQKFTGTFILVSHDRRFLRLLVNRVFAIDHGALHTYEGDYSYYLRKSAEERL